jgi:hypothetical protein
MNGAVFLLRVYVRDPDRDDFNFLVFSHLEEHVIATYYMKVFLTFSSLLVACTNTFKT